jgi:hypothetical protein
MKTLILIFGILLVVAMAASVFAGPKVYNVKPGDSTVVIVTQTVDTEVTINEMDKRIARIDSAIAGHQNQIAMLQAEKNELNADRAGMIAAGGIKK